MKIDAKEITDALRALFVKGDVFEIRCLDATLPGARGYAYPHVESGYFDYAHIDAVPAALSELESARGVYVTVNPVSDMLLSRANNRIFNPKRQARTTDDDIVRRRWLFIDCDARRPSGISSSFEEHEAALSKAREISVGMASIGWPEPIIVDSGNGAHVLYSIDLPAKDGGIVERIIRRVSNVGDDMVEIDRSVFNPARIIRLPGTFNCKGDPTESRPHRMARIVSMPSGGIDMVPLERLKSVAGEARVNPPETQSSGYGGDFDLAAWIREHCPEARRPVDTPDGRKWVLEHCPFNHEHRAPDSYIYQFSNGKFYFKCSHNSCAGKDFHALRDLLDPGWRASRSLPEFDGVDISGIVAKDAMSNKGDSGFDDIPDEDMAEPSGFVPFPEELYGIGGFIGRVMKHTLDEAPVPNRALALSGALALMSFLTARKVETHTGLRGNIYLLALAKSGAGKERPRDVNQFILEGIGLDCSVLENVASGEGLEDMLVRHSAVLWQCDEFYSILHNMSVEDSDSRNTIMKYLLSLYTSSQKNFLTRSRAGVEGVTIVKPYVVLYASTTPNGFFENIGERFLNDGMFARMNIMVADEPKRPQLRSKTRIPDDIIATAVSWRDYRPAGSGNIDVEAATVPCTPDASELESGVFDEQYDMMESIRKGDNPAEWREAAWNRYYEMTMRYALLYACSAASEPSNAVITRDAVEWGRKFARWDIENKLEMTSERYFRSEFEKLSETVMEFMKRWHQSNGAAPMPAWKLNRKMRFIKDSKNVVESLISQKRLARDVVSTGKRGRPAEVYYLPSEAAKARKQAENSEECKSK